MSYTDLLKLWDKFWFTESSPLPVAAYRLLFGALALGTLIFILPDLYVFYGARGITTAQGVVDWTGTPGLTVFNLVPNNDVFVTICYVIFMLAALALSVGYKPRIASVILFLGLNALYHRDPFILNSGDSYMRVSVFWMIFAASGNAISVDRLLKKKQNKESTDLEGPDFDNYKPVSVWPLRLLQLQLALVYCHTFYRKFWGANWFDGNAVYYSSRVEDLRRFPLPFVFENMWTIQFLTWGTLVIEFALFTLIWFRETRYLVLAGAVIFHLVIDYHMNIPFFEYLMIASYVLFIYPEDLARFLRFINKRLGKNQVR
ncbi:MAG: HTTM domain-containing protein [Cyanobacteria bacterium SZAS LIN-2]|nr:HTTM domain-containing protein [Cyanobacteria bacterium SZAS LIN-2]